MKHTVIRSHFAPCSEENLSFRLQQCKLYESEKNNRVKFWDCKNAEEYRQLEREGKGTFDKPIYDPDAETIYIKSGEWDSNDKHEIPVRILKPNTNKPKGVFMFLHGGGWVVGSATLHDNLLRELAERTSLIIASVEYRLAPEFKLPAGTQDCVDAARYFLSADYEQEAGIRLRFIGGESAGAYLTIQTTLMLRDTGINVRERLDGILPTYSPSDLSLLPSARGSRASFSIPVTPQYEGTKYLSLALPEKIWTSRDALKAPEWSPLYANMENLPSACFAVGTEDRWMDDSVMLAIRWELAGNDTDLIIYPGTPHGYLVTDLDATKESIDDIVRFVVQRLRP